VDVIHLYCDIERKESHEYFDMSMAWNDVLCCPIPSILSGIDWIGHTWQPNCLYVMKLISVQYVRQLLLAEHEKQDNLKIRQIIEFICVLCDSSESKPWSGKVSSIDYGNCGVAYWHLIANHLPIFIPYLDDSQLLALAQLVITSLHSDDTLVHGHMTMHTVTQLLVHSPVFLEIRRLHACIIDCVFTRVASSLYRCLQGKHSKTAWKVGEKIWHHQASWKMERQEIGVDRINEFVSLSAASLTNKQARKKLREMLNLEWSEQVDDVFGNALEVHISAKGMRRVKRDEGNETKAESKMADCVLKQLEVFHVLPLHWLMPDEIIRCFLGLIMTCILLEIVQLDGQSVCLHFLVKIVDGLESSNGRLFKACLSVAVSRLQPLSDWLIRYYKQNEDGLSLLRHLLAFGLQTTSLASDIVSLAQQARNGLEEAIQMVNVSDSSTVMNVEEQQVLVECILSACNKALQSRDVILSSISAITDCLSVPVSKTVTLLVHIMSVEPETTAWSTTFSSCIKLFTDFLKVCHTVASKQKTTDSQAWKDTSEMIDAVQKAFNFALCHLESMKPKKINIDMINQCLQLIGLVFYQEIAWNDVIHTKFTHIWNVLLKLHRKLCSKWHRKLCAKSVGDSLSIESPMLEFEQLLVATEDCLGRLLGASAVEEMESAMHHLHRLTVQCSSHNDNDCQTVLSITRIWQLALHIKHKQEKVKLVIVHHIPKVMVSFLAVFQTSTVECCEAILSVIRLLSEFLSRGKMVLSGASALIGLHACLLVPLSPVSNSFQALFSGVYNIVHMLLHHHLECAITAVPVIIQCLKRMLGAVLELARSACVQEDADDNVPSSLSSSKQLNCVNNSVTWQSTVQCAKLMSRLYEEIARVQVFSKYTPYMVAEYIRLSQKWTPTLEVKHLLVPGVYKLLDLCSEHEMALLYATLDKPGKELLQVLHDDYKTHHKYKGQV
jgi:hypothetical protein